MTRNSKRKMVSSARSVPMVVHETMEYVMPPLSKIELQEKYGVFYVVRVEML
jgi:hypothetical protein